jgi:hypothetical protein
MVAPSHRRDLHCRCDWLAGLFPWHAGDWGGVVSETCTIVVTVTEDYDRCYGHDLEVVVKNAWTAMVPFYTARHGVRHGAISLNEGVVKIEWSYSADDEVEGEQ